ncbi:MAG: tRNA-binding protein [Sphingomonadales bacterium]
MSEITCDDFAKVELRVGTVISAEVFNEARVSAYLLQVDFGEEVGIKKSSAQITDYYEPAELVGKQVIGVTNLPPKQIGPIQSECLITGFYKEGKRVVLATLDMVVPNGARLV